MSDIDSIANAIRKAPPLEAGGHGHHNSIAGTYLHDSHVIKGNGNNRRIDLVNFADSYGFAKATAEGKESQVSQDFARERHNFDKAYASYAASEEGKKLPANRQQFAQALSQVYERGFGERDNANGSKSNTLTQKELNRVSKEIDKIGTTQVLPTTREVNAAGKNAQEYLASVKSLPLENGSTAATRQSGTDVVETDAIGRKRTQSAASTASQDKPPVNDFQKKSNDLYAALLHSLPPEVAQAITAAFGNLGRSGSTVQESGQTQPQYQVANASRNAAQFEAVTRTT